MNRWLAGRLFWPATERLCGRDTMSRFRALIRTQHCSADEQRAIQNRKLRRLLRLADRHCPFYARRFAEAGLDPNDPRLTVDDLRALPPLTKDDIRTHLADMTWIDCPGGIKPFNTGGSTGRPLQFSIDRFRTAADAAARLRARTWWNVHPGDPEILLWGAPTELNTRDRIRRWRDALLNQTLLDAFDLTDRTMDAYIAFIRRRRPACLYGYPSSLSLLARHALCRGLAPGDLGSPRLKAVFATGEVLLDHDRAAIASAFAVPVVIEYGCRDGGLLAMGCPDGSLHVVSENVIVELLDADGRPISAGRVGEVVVTHLEALAMPIIRYRLGDETSWSDDRACTCGRTGPTLGPIRGRLTDHIVCRHGDQIRRMHALSLIYVLREAPGIIRFRVVQPSIDRIEVEVVTNDRFTSEVRRTVERGLRRRLGEHVAIEIRRRDRIPPLASGKHACVICRVDPEMIEDRTPAATAPLA